MDVMEPLPSSSDRGRFSKVPSTSFFAQMFGVARKNVSDDVDTRSRSMARSRTADFKTVRDEGRPKGLRYDKLAMAYVAQAFRPAVE
jgi:hypothetical protein